jgi:hypothetical protein
VPNYSLLILSATLILSGLQVTCAADNVPPSQTNADEEPSSWWLEEPVMARTPNIDVWVHMRGVSGKYVVSQLESAATGNGMICDPQKQESQRLLCQFQGAADNAIDASDDGVHLVRILFYYTDHVNEKVDPSRRATIDTIVRQFTNELNRSGQIRRIERCKYPRSACRHL